VKINIEELKKREKYIGFKEEDGKAR